MVKFGARFFTNQTALLVAGIRGPNAQIRGPIWTLLEIRNLPFFVLSAPIFLMNYPKNYMKNVYQTSNDRVSSQPQTCIVTCPQGTNLK